MTYCQHQREAVRLVCQRCKRPYDVTNTKPDAEFVCVWCKRSGPCCDVNGVPMEGGATGP